MNPYILITNKIDRPVCHVPSGPLINIKKLKEIKSYEFTQKRAGVIVYTILNGKIYFCMGVDYVHGSLTDFSGGIKSSEETVISGAFREFKEESLGIFPELSSDIIENSIAVYSNAMMTIFLRMKVNMTLMYNSFTTRVVNVYKPEIKELVWITRNKFFLFIKENDPDKIYHKVLVLINTAYSEHGDFISILN